MSRIFSLMFLAKPKQEPTHLDAAAGAYINCWIRAESLTAAEQIARSEIELNEWITESLEESYECSSKQYDDPEDMKCYLLAKTEGKVFVYHTWPLCEEDSDKMQ